MALTTLVDCYNMAIGAATLARPTQADFSLEPTKVQSACDAVLGQYEDDVCYYDLKASLQAEDPLAAPTIAAITAASAVTATGRTVNAATYQKLTVGHGVLVGLGVEIADAAAGRLTAEFQNVAASAAAAPAAELVGASGSEPSLIERRGTIRIIGASSTFTPDVGDAISLIGLSKVSWRAQAIVRASSSPGALMIDQLTLLGWLISGSLSFSDKTLATGVTPPVQLIGATRGIMAVQCRMTGFASETPPDDQIFSLDRIKFERVGEGFRSRNDAGGDVSFGGILRAADNSLLDLADLIAVAAAV